MSETITEHEAVEEPVVESGAEAVSDEQLIAMLVDRARSDGLQLIGEGGLLQQLTKASILGNTDPLLHAYVWPRFEWEAEVAGKPVWLSPRERWRTTVQARSAARPKADVPSRS
ncbi:hypothetical protein [Streptomyces sp. NPDC058434]|uniref:hypothetical protein n=1 Tax=Streptomyces sp. NPDC058434 TaxID=3346498 RepID=UPI003664CE79